MPTYVMNSGYWTWTTGLDDSWYGTPTRPKVLVVPVPKTPVTRDGRACALPSQFRLGSHLAPILSAKELSEGFLDDERTRLYDGRRCEGVTRAWITTPVERCDRRVYCIGMEADLLPAALVVGPTLQLDLTDLGWLVGVVISPDPAAISAKVAESDVVISTVPRRGWSPEALEACDGRPIVFLNH